MLRSLPLKRRGDVTCRAFVSERRETIEVRDDSKEAWDERATAAREALQRQPHLSIVRQRAELYERAAALAAPMAHVTTPHPSRRSGLVKRAKKVTRIRDPPSCAQILSDVQSEDAFRRVYALVRARHRSDELMRAVTECIYRDERHLIFYDHKLTSRWPSAGEFAEMRADERNRWVDMRGEGNLQAVLAFERLHDAKLDCTPGVLSAMRSLLATKTTKPSVAREVARFMVRFDDEASVEASIGSKYASCALGTLEGIKDDQSRQEWCLRSRLALVVDANADISRAAFEGLYGVIDLSDLDDDYLKILTGARNAVHKIRLLKLRDQMGTAVQQSPIFDRMVDDVGEDWGVRHAARACEYDE